MMKICKGSSSQNSCLLKTTTTTKNNKSRDIFSNVVEARSVKLCLDDSFYQSNWPCSRWLWWPRAIFKVIEGEFDQTETPIKTAIMLSRSLVWMWGSQLAASSSVLALTTERTEHLKTAVGLSWNLNESPPIRFPCCVFSTPAPCQADTHTHARTHARTHPPTHTHLAV